MRLLSLFFKLAELGVRASLASVGNSVFLKACDRQSSVSAWSSTVCPVPPSQSGSSCSRRHLLLHRHFHKRWALTMCAICCPRVSQRHLSTIAVCATSHRGRSSRQCYTFLWWYRPPEVWAVQATAPLKSSEAS